MCCNILVSINFMGTDLEIFNSFSRTCNSLASVKTGFFLTFFARLTLPVVKSKIYPPPFESNSCNILLQNNYAVINLFVFLLVFANCTSLFYHGKWERTSFNKFEFQLVFTLKFCYGMCLFWCQLKIWNFVYPTL